MAHLSADCKKRMTLWCFLAVALLAIVAMSGYVIFESPGHGPPVQQQRLSPARSDR